MENLPRDLQLHVIKKFDMDTRIKTGIIGKLKVPENLVKDLEKLQPPRLFGNDGFIYSVQTKTLLISWDEALEERSIGILKKSDLGLYDYWIANNTHTEWLDIYEYVYGYVEL